MIYRRLLFGPAANLGQIQLDTRIAGSPDEPVKRLVRVYRENDDGQPFQPSREPSALTVVATVWTTPAGKRTVEHLDPTRTYTAIAYDHTGVHDPVIKAGLVPEVPE